MTDLSAWLDDDPMVNEIQTLSEKIRQRRTQMMIHSYLYYVLDVSFFQHEFSNLNSLIKFLRS